VKGRWHERSPVVRVLLGVIGMLIIFYTVPVSTDESPGRAAFSILLTLSGVAALAWAILAQVRRQLRSRSEDIHTLLMLLPLTAVVFALGFYLMELHLPGQIPGITTRTDALYFTLSTLTTVGFGDITAQGQLARGVVILQLVFNAVFVGAAVSIVVGTIRNRAPSLAQDGDHDSR
jgi:voltage-gated potassium channel